MSRREGQREDGRERDAEAREGGDEGGAKRERGVGARERARGKHSECTKARRSNKKNQTCALLVA
jgi:hypothetical protein